MGLESENGAAGSRRAAHHLTAREWLLLLVLATVQFTFIVDFVIILPLGPTYMREMGLQPQEFSAVVAAYTIGAGLAALIASRVLDRFGRKAALLTLYAGFVAGTFLCAAAPGYWSLLAARAVAGAFGGVAAAVVYAIVGDVFPDARRGTAMGVVTSALSVALILGVPLGLGLEQQFTWQAPFLALGGLGVGILALAILLLPPLRGHLGRHGAPAGPNWALFTDPNHLRAFGLTVALVFGSFTIYPLLATFLEFNIGLKHTHLPYMYLCGGLATLATLTPIGRLADAIGKLSVFRGCALATLVTTVGIVTLPAGTHLSLVLVATSAFMVATSGRMVPAMAMITASAAPQDRGGFLSLNASVQHLASGVATVAAGLIVAAREDKSLIGFPLVGLLACTSTAASLYLAGRLRPAPGGTVAPDVTEVGRMSVPELIN